MNGDYGDTDAFAEVGLFLGYFEDLPDARQPDKIRYPLNEILLLCLLAVLSGGGDGYGYCLPTSVRASLRSRGGFERLQGARSRTTISATCWPRSMPRRSSAASSPGLRR